MKQVDYKNSQTKTDPWDFDVDDTKTLFWFSLLLTLFILISFQSAVAQRAFPLPTPDMPEMKSPEKVERLTRQEIQAAKDYQEILLKLEFLFQNHLEYFSNYKNYEGRKYQNLLLKTLIKMEKGSYCANVEQLTADLSKLSASLLSDEKKFKKVRKEYKLAKNLKSLRADIDIIEDILTEEIAEQLHAHETSIEEIKVFLQKEQKELKLQDDYQIKMYELQELLHEGMDNFLESQESLHIKFDEAKMRELFEAEELQKEFAEVLDLVFTIELPNKIIKVNIPSDSLGKEIIVHTPSPPSPPPAPPVFPGDHSEKHETHNSYAYNYQYNYDGKPTIFNRYQDSVYVKSSKIPIYIENQLGNLEVKGWDRAKIVAIYTYEVTSEDIDDATSFSESVTLDINSDRSGIYVTSDFPNLSNTKRQVVSSSMILQVPKKNILHIKNSFGKTDISKFNSDISIRAKNSKIMVQDIYGKVEAYSKNSNIFLQNINGEVEVTSSRGKVIIDNVSSTIFVENSNAPTIITDCQGDATLINSGEVVVTEHRGNLDIKNKNGQTTVSTLKGNLTLTGSYQPFIINSVEGSVNIQNKNAVVSLTDVSGKSIVSNQSGQIKAFEIHGPIDFSNHGGEIYFVADNMFEGNSNIRSDYGLINIILPQQSNVLLNASTEGGSITNSYQTKIQNDDFLSSTTIALGNKSKKLQVTGTNATIIIKDSK